MAKRSFTYLDYMKEAFNLKVPVKLLGGVPVNKALLLGFGILGIGYPGFWLLGLAYETAYLMALPGNERFQRLVQADALRIEQEKQGSVHDEILTKLSSSGRERFFKLSEVCENILKQTEDRDSTLSVAELRAGGINDMLLVFLKLLAASERAEKVASLNSENRVREEIKHTEERLASEATESKVADSLRKILEIQQKRLDNLLRAKEELKVSGAELERIEKQVMLLSEECASTGQVKILSERLDDVSKSLEGTNHWISSQAHIASILEEDK